MSYSSQAGLSLANDWEALNAPRISMEVVCEVRAMLIPQRSESCPHSEDLVRTKAMNMFSRLNKQ